MIKKLFITFGPKKSNLWSGTQDFCLDFVSRNDARWHTQNKFFEIFLDFVSENDARWRTQFLDFVSEICQYGLRVLGRIKINSNKIPFYSKRKIFNSTFSRIHNESTLFRKFSINSLPVFPIQPRLLGIHHLFSEFIMNSISVSRINYFVAISLGILNLFRESTMNSFFN